jgi:hypothetical protein
MADFATANGWGAGMGSILTGFRLATNPDGYTTKRTGPNLNHQHLNHDAAVKADNPDHHRHLCHNPF